MQAVRAENREMRATCDLRTVSVGDRVCVYGAGTGTVKAQVYGIGGAVQYQVWLDIGRGVVAYVDELELLAP